MYTCKDMQTGAQTGKLTGAHTRTHMFKSTSVGRQDSPTGTHVCSPRHVGTQRQVHLLTPMHTLHTLGTHIG